MCNRIKPLLLFGCVVTIVASCEKTMYMDLPYDMKKIVVNGIITPEYGMWINLSKSVSTPESSFTSYLPITNGIVNYYQGGALITSITNRDDGNYYETEYKPQVNREYEIKVNAPGMPEAHANVKIPEPVEILDFDTSSVIKQIHLYNNPVQYEIDFYITFSFEDPDTVGNHYMLGIYYLDNDAYHPLNADNEDINMDVYIKDGINVLAWNDQHFNGLQKEFSVCFTMVQPAGFETNIRFYLYSIEENYYKYLKSYSQNYTILNEDALLYEGVQVFSNIEGGYGILAAASSTMRSFNYRF